MPTPTKGPRLGGSASHERLMMANLATSLFEHGSITTTEAKARRLRPLAERLITKSKRGDLHNRREVMKTIRDKDVVHKLFAEIGPFFADRNGGYTRIVKTMPRRGDNAKMAIISLVTERTATAEAEAARGTRFARSRTAQSDTEAAAAVPEAAAEAATVEDAAVEDAAVEEDTAAESDTAESDTAESDTAESDTAESEAGEES